MKKFSSLLISAVLAAFMVGCASNTKQLGTVSGVTFYRVKSRDFSGPNFTSLVAEKDGNVAVVETFGGPGLGATTISAVGQIGSSAVLGLSFPKNVGDKINITGGGAQSVSNSRSQSDARGGNATGGAGGNSNATGGNSNATSGSSSQGGTANGGGQFVPPGHINNPGHGGHNQP